MIEKTVEHTTNDGLKKIYNIIIDDEDNGNSMEREKLQQELREFLEEQSTTVLTIYMNDYFEKEISHTRGQYADALKQLIIAYLGANTAYYMTSTTSSVTPRIKMERMKLYS